MPAMTTESGQAADDLISLFQQAQALARRERARAQDLQAVIDTAAAMPTETDDDGQVCVRMTPEVWAQLQGASHPT